MGWIRDFGERRGVSTGPVGEWTYQHRRGLRIGAVALVALIFVFWGHPTLLVVILLVVILLLLLGLIELIGRPAAQPLRLRSIRLTHASSRASRPDERTVIMTVPVNVDVSESTREVLTALALGDPDMLAAGLEVRAEWKARSGLDARSYALVKLAALIALDAPPASYLWQVANALDAGATPEDLIGVLIAIAPQVGGPKLVAAAPELMVALGLSLPDGM